MELIKDLKTVDLVDLVKRAFQLFLESLEDKFMAVIKSSAPQILTADSSATPSPAQTLILNSTGAQKALQECKASFKLLFTKTKQMEELKARAYKKVFPEKKPGQQKPKPDRKKRKARQMDDDDLSSKFVGSLGETDGLSDDDVELAETIETKKNRPGQRARREIWEKKYGTGANHIKNATNEETNPKPVKKHEEDLSSLHPSWAAKKKQKLVIASAHSAAGQGKKITFDQDSGTPAPLKIAVKPQNPNCPSSAHPSWDAKRKEKEALAQKLASAPKAKKIVFE